MFGLFELLTGEGVGFVTREDVNVTVSDEFLRGVGGIDVHFRRRKWIIFRINGLQNETSLQVATCLPFKESKSVDRWSIGDMKRDSLIV